MMLVANRFTHQPERENYKKFLKKHVRVRLLFTKYAHYVVHYTEHLLKWHLKWCTRTWAGVLSGWTVLPSHAGRSRRSEGPAKQNTRVNASKTVYKNMFKKPSETPCSYTQWPARGSNPITIRLSSPCSPSYAACKLTFEHTHTHPMTQCTSAQCLTRTACLRIPQCPFVILSLAFSVLPVRPVSCGVKWRACAVLF